MSRNIRRRGLASLFILALSLLVMPCFSQDTVEGHIGGDFTLTDYNGEPWSLADQRGKLVLVFFGYTYCPDICPTELSMLARLLRDVGDKADKIKTVFITIDPERDTVEKLKQYVPYFSPQLIGLTGSSDEINQVADAYQVQRKIHAHQPGDKHYRVDHAAHLYVIGADGQLKQMIPFGFPPEHIKRVIEQELAG